MNQDEHASENDAQGGQAVATAPVKRPAKKPPKPLPPYKLLLHNDDVNDVEYVVKTILKITPLGTKEAQQRTLEAHTLGLSLLLTTHRERAELYQEQFTSAGLTVTIESA